MIAERSDPETSHLQQLDPTTDNRPIHPQAMEEFVLENWAPGIMLYVFEGFQELIEVSKWGGRVQAILHCALFGCIHLLLRHTSAI
jgi:hypothetical protein